MFLVDTNVLSDGRRRWTPASVWLWSIARERVYLNVISLGELQKGFELKARRDPVGAQPLFDWLMSVRELHGDRVLAITDDVALEWGRLEVRRPRGWDGLMAATAVVHGLTLVTRNVADFRDVPVRLINPWASS